VVVDLGQNIAANLPLTEVGDERVFAHEGLVGGHSTSTVRGWPTRSSPKGGRQGCPASTRTWAATCSAQSSCARSGIPTKPKQHRRRNFLLASVSTSSCFVICGDARRGAPRSSVSASL